VSIWAEFGIWNLEGCIMTNSDEVRKLLLVTKFEVKVEKVL
jgi:hypothetical protein